MITSDALSGTLNGANLAGSIGAFEATLQINDNNIELVLVTPNPTTTLVIDLGTSPAGTSIEGGTFIGTGPTNLPLPALPAGSILKSIAVDAVLESGDDNYASDLSLLLDPTPGTPGGDFSVEITNGPTPLGGAALDLNWPTSANAGPGTALIDTDRRRLGIRRPDRPRHHRSLPRERLQYHPRGRHLVGHHHPDL